MFPVLMRLVILMAVLCAIYVGLSRYMRWDRTRRLESEHASGQGGTLSREDYVAIGLVKYDQSWARKMLLGVFILPVLAALALVLVANYG